MNFSAGERYAIGWRSKKYPPTVWYLFEAAHRKFIQHFGKMLFSDAHTPLLLCIFLPLLSAIAQTNFDLCRGKLRSLFRRRKPTVWQRKLEWEKLRFKTFICRVLCFRFIQLIREVAKKLPFRIHFDRHVQAENFILVIAGICHQNIILVAQFGTPSHGLT